MRLHTKPRPWACLATSFAMALDMQVETFFHMVGHDGGEVIFPHLPEPMCRRGFHIDEAIRVCVRRGYSATPVELFPATAPTMNNLASAPMLVRYGSEDDHWSQFTTFINHFKGVLEGRGHRCLHAVAFDHGRIYDPDGREYDYSRQACEARHFYGHKLWLIQETK